MGQTDNVARSCIPGDFQPALATGAVLCYSLVGLERVGPFRDGTKVCTDMEDIHIPSTLRQVFPDGHKSKVSYRFDNDVTIHAGTLVFPPKRGVHFDQ
mgnify:CR=1 FL=1